MELRDFDPNAVEGTSLRKTNNRYRRAAKAKKLTVLGFKQRTSNRYKLTKFFGTCFIYYHGCVNLSAITDRAIS
jgi:hypothetical protein